MDSKEILSALAPLIKSFVEVLIKPKLEALKKDYILFKKAILPIEELFGNYFLESYLKHTYLNSLVFKNSQLLLKNVYIPLRLQISNSQREFKILGWDEDLFKTVSQLLIVDTAGMGKSTLAKIIFLNCIDNHKAIPFFIELRKLSKDKSIVQEIISQLSSLTEVFDEGLLFQLFQTNKFLFILDGFDEIQITQRTFVVEDIKSFIYKTKVASNQTKDPSVNKYIITSREETALGHFGDFERSSINNLTPKEAYQLLDNYDQSKTLSSILISKLQNPNLSSVHEFLINPLLVSLLFTAFEYKHEVPFKKTIFYRQVFDANFQSHDLIKDPGFTREKRCQLDSEEFHKILRHIAYFSIKDNVLFYSKDSILKRIDAAKLYSGDIQFKNSDFLIDLVVTVPMFMLDGFEYRWVHKSILEYFCCQFIYLDSKSFQNDILKAIYYHPNYMNFQNILDIYYDTDSKGFRTNIIYYFLLEYKKHCLRKDSYIHEQEKEQIDLRWSITFYFNTVLVNKGISYTSNSSWQERALEFMKSVKLSDEIKKTFRSYEVPLKLNYNVLNVYQFYGRQFMIAQILHLHQENLFCQLKQPFRFFSTKEILKIIDMKLPTFSLITDETEDVINTAHNFKYINNILLDSEISELILDDELTEKQLKKIGNERNEILNNSILP